MLCCNYIYLRRICPSCLLVLRPLYLGWFIHYSTLTHSTGLLLDRYSQTHKTTGGKNDDITTLFSWLCWLLVVRSFLILTINLLCKMGLWCVCSVWIYFYFSCFYSCNCFYFIIDYFLLSSLFLFKAATICQLLLWSPSLWMKVEHFFL